MNIQDIPFAARLMMVGLALIAVSGILASAVGSVASVAVPLATGAGLLVCAAHQATVGRG